MADVGAIHPIDTIREVLPLGTTEPAKTQKSGIASSPIWGYLLGREEVSPVICGTSRGIQALVLIIQIIPDANQFNTSPLSINMDG